MRRESTETTARRRALLRHLCLLTCLGALTATADEPDHTYRVQVRSPDGPVRDFTVFRHRFLDADAGVAEVSMPSNEFLLAAEVRAPGFFAEERSLDGGASADLGTIVLERSRLVVFKVEFPKATPPHRRQVNLVGRERFALRSSALELELPVGPTKVWVLSPFARDQLVEVPVGTREVSVKLEPGNRLDVRVRGVDPKSFANGWGTRLSVTCEGSEEQALPSFQVASDGVEHLTGLPDGECLVSLQVRDAPPVTSHVTLPATTPLTLDGRLRH